MANVAPPGLTQILTDNGVPAAGYLLYTYDAGTSTPRLTWSNSAESVANANPIVLDASGRAQIFWRGNYRIQLQTPAAAVVWTQDNFNVPDVAAANGSISWQQAGGTVGVAGQFTTVNFPSNLATLVAAGSTLNITIGGSGTVTFGGGVFNGAAGLQVTGGPFASRGIEDLATADAWQVNANGVLRDVGNAGAGGQPTVQAYRATSAQASGTTCIWNTEQSDIGSQYDSATGIYTAAVTQRVIFGFCGIVANASGGSVDRGMFATTSGGSGNQRITAGQDFRTIANGASAYINAVGYAYLEAGDTLRIDASAAFTASITLATTAGNGFWVKQVG